MSTLFSYPVDGLSTGACARHIFVFPHDLDRPRTKLYSATTLSVPHEHRQSQYTALPAMPFGLTPRWITVHLPNFLPTRSRMICPSWIPRGINAFLRSIVAIVYSAVNGSLVLIGVAQ